VVHLPVTSGVTGVAGVAGCVVVGGVPLLALLPLSSLPQP